RAGTRGRVRDVQFALVVVDGPGRKLNRMKYSIQASMFRTLASVCVVLAAVTWLFAAESTVTGELVDVACYTKDSVKNVGVVHQDCATLCAMKGEPLAVVTDKGDLYTIVGDLTHDRNAMVAPHMSHRVV